MREWRDLVPLADITLDTGWTICNADGQEVTVAEPSVRAIIVTQNCSWGAVRVDSDLVTNVVTGNGSGYYL